MVPLFSRGLNCIRTRQTMEAYLCSPPTEYQKMILSTSNKNSIEYVGQIEDDWSGSPSSSKIPEGTQIQLILVNDPNKDERHSFDIGSTTTLKCLFNHYASKRGVSLRSQRFSYHGKVCLIYSLIFNPNRVPLLDMLHSDYYCFHIMMTRPFS